MTPNNSSIYWNPWKWNHQRKLRHTISAPVSWSYSATAGPSVRGGFLSGAGCLLATACVHVCCQLSTDVNSFVEIEHGTFTPLVFSCYGGMGRECSYFYKRLAEKLAEKRNISCSEAVCFIRTKINFSLIKSLVLCIRGSRTVRNDDVSIADTDIVFSNDISGTRKWILAEWHWFNIVIGHDILLCSIFE